jgi:hypothetical protein
MAESVPTHVKEIEARVEEAIKLLREIRVEPLEELLITIRRPGWTTPAEALLFLKVAEIVQGSASQIGRMTDVLVEAGKQIGEGG